MTFSTINLIMNENVVSSLKLAAKHCGKSVSDHCAEILIASLGEKSTTSENPPDGWHTIRVDNASSHDIDPVVFMDVTTSDGYSFKTSCDMSYGDYQSKRIANFNDFLRLSGATISTLSSSKGKTFRALIQTYKNGQTCLLYTSPSPRDATLSRMPSSA